MIVIKNPDTQAAENFIRLEANAMKRMTLTVGNNFKIVSVIEYWPNSTLYSKYEIKFVNR